MTRSGNGFTVLRRVVFILPFFSIVPNLASYRTRSMHDFTPFSSAITIPLIISIVFTWVATVIVGPYFLFNDARTAMHCAPILIGIEGVVDTAKVERYLFGHSTGRFTTRQFAPGQLSLGGATSHSTTGIDRAETLGNEGHGDCFAARHKDHDNHSSQGSEPTDSCNHLWRRKRHAARAFLFLRLDDSNISPRDYHSSIK